MKVLLVVALAMVALVSPSRADDDKTREAAQHFDAGVAWSKRGNPLAALAEFEKAYALVSQWELLFNIGITQRTLNRYGAAIKTLDRYLLEGGDRVPADRRKRVEDELAELRRLVGAIVVVVDGAPARIEIDQIHEGDTPLVAPILVAPGKHVVRASRGDEVDERPISVVSGESAEIRLSPKAVPTVGRITILTRPPGATIRVDNGAPKPAPWIGDLGSGGHRVIAELRGHRTETTEINISVGQERTLSLDLVALPRSERKPLYRRPVFWAAIAIGLTASVGTIALLAQPEGSDVVLRWP